MALLEIEGLRKSYRTPDGSVLEVLDVPSYTQEAGDQVALEGTSGSGKTTFLHCIAGILTPDTGTVVVAGQSLTETSEATRDGLRARHIGYVFQSFHLLQGLSALENIEIGMVFGAGRDRERAMGLLERVGLADRAEYLPRQLSVGQQQRIAVARALANRPALVLADEPTGNLDRRSAAESLNLMRETCREEGAALLLVSHSTEILASFEVRQRLVDVNHAAARPESEAAE